MVYKDRLMKEWRLRERKSRVSVDEDETKLFGSLWVVACVEKPNRNNRAHFQLPTFIEQIRNLFAVRCKKIASASANLDHAADRAIHAFDFVKFKLAKSF